jgi:hypothetical protein
MTFAEHLAESDPQQVLAFRKALARRSAAGEPVYAAVVNACGEVGLPRPVAMRAMAVCEEQNDPLSVSLGWPWLRRWEVAGDLITGLTSWIPKTEPREELAVLGDSRTVGFGDGFGVDETVTARVLDGP